VASDEPANADFDSLQRRRTPMAIESPTRSAELDPATQRRIEESVALLDSYFSAQDGSGEPLANAQDGTGQPGVPVYDPSAELGPTGTSHLARPTEPAFATADLPVRPDAPVTIPADAIPDAMTAEQRLLSGMDLVTIDPAPAQTGEPGTPETRTAYAPNLAVSVAEPAPVPGLSSGMGLVTADDRPLDPEDFGPSMATADGTLPTSVLDPGPANGETRTVSAAERKDELVEELVGLLTELSDESSDPYRSGLALAGLESLSPGALYELVDSGELLPHETEVLLSVHEFLQGLAASDSDVSPDLAMDLVDDIRERLNQTASLEITGAELCVRVMGYGQYDTFPKTDEGGYRFAAGRRQPVIIYTEVDRFGRTPFVDEDGVTRWQVELSQELQIFRVDDDLLVTARQAQTDTSLSRARMRDYYLINQTALPETLSVGRYRLKVIMRDANKDAIAEAVIPFEIVPSERLIGP